MSFKDAIKRACISESEMIEERVRKAEATRYWDSFYKARVKPFALETTSQNVLEAYHQMINGRGTDLFSNEANYIIK